MFLAVVTFDGKVQIVRSVSAVVVVMSNLRMLDSVELIVISCLDLFFFPRCFVLVSGS